MKDEHEVSAVFAQCGIFHAPYVELHFDALRGFKAFVGDPPVHSHMTSEGTLPLVAMSFQYTAQRQCLSC